ncbi:AroM protein [Klebsiella pneumoniae subsp. ozaenae]|uniref:AroM protein n=1 Tax=Klebsiella pneumoniae subsp. ozaenae TaxID=574 RepID=A0A377Z281_KLEPO|nr:AroM protein [Klebsiella pneumoniae subsp. ozaenae]
MAILTIGVVPLAGVLPLLTEHIREEQIAHISLLGEMTPDEVMAEYAVGDGEKGLLTLLSNNQLVMVSRQKIERDVRSAIAMLDRQHYDVILLLSSEQLTGFTTHHAILLEPQRIIPPLVASIVDGHQVGVIVPVEEIMPMQRQKWLSLEKSPYYALANPFTGSDSELLTAGKRCWSRAPTCWSSTVSVTISIIAMCYKKPSMFRFCCRMCWFPDWRQNYWSNVLISRDRGKERPLY